MADRQLLSRAETCVARVLWGLKEATARQITEALPANQRRDFSTVQTYLTRLESKGYVRSRLVGRTKIFRPTIKPTQVIRDTVDDLVDRLFEGQAYPLLKHLVEDRKVSPAELNQLRTLIDQLEAGDRAGRDEAGRDAKGNDSSGGLP